jgi:hypothetical protein
MNKKIFQGSWKPSQNPVKVLIQQSVPIIMPVHPQNVFFTAYSYVNLLDTKPLFKIVGCQKRPMETMSNLEIDWVHCSSWIHLFYTGSDVDRLGRQWCILS